MSFTIGFSGAKCIARSVGFAAQPHWCLSWTWNQLREYCGYMLPLVTVAHDSLVCKMALLIVWNNMGTDTLFAISPTTYSNVFLCVSLRAVDCKGHQKEGGGVTQSRPSSRTSSLKRKGNCHNLRNMLCQAFCTTIHCNIMTPFVGCWNKLGECFEIFYLSARNSPLISTRFSLL